MNSLFYKQPLPWRALQRWIWVTAEVTALGVILRDNWAGILSILFEFMFLLSFFFMFLMHYVKHPKLSMCMKCAIEINMPCLTTHLTVLSKQHRIWTKFMYNLYIIYDFFLWVSYLIHTFLRPIASPYSKKLCSKTCCIQSDTSRLPPGGYLLHYSNSDISHGKNPKWLNPISPQLVVSRRSILLFLRLYGEIFFYIFTNNSKWALTLLKQLIIT